MTQAEVRGIKYLPILFVIVTVIFLFNQSTAGMINLGFSSIKIETNFSPDLVDFFNNDSNNKEYQIEGPYVITICNIRKNINMELFFVASDWESYQLITERMMLQYRVVSYSEQGNWSQWLSLKSFPLRINLNCAGNQNGFSERILIYLRLKVSQSIDIQSGVYQGGFSLAVK